MTVLEITLAVILTLLGLAILAILLTRWARRKQSEMYISRYSSEQRSRHAIFTQQSGKLYCDSFLSSFPQPFCNVVSMASKFSLGQTELILLLMCFILALSRSSIGSIKCLQTTEEPPCKFPIYTTQNSLHRKENIMGEKTVAKIPLCFSAGPPSAPRGKKYLISKSRPFVVCSVILTGYMDEELAKKSCSKIQILKCGGTARSQNSREENKEALKNDIIFTNSVESLKSAHIKEPEREGKGTDLEKDKIGMEVKVDSDAGIPKRQETQLKISEMSVPQGQGAQIKKSVSDVPRGQESQVKKSESGVPKGQEAQVTKSGLVVLKGQEAQVEKSEMGVPRRQESQVKKSESGVSKGQEAQVKKRESVVLKGQEAQVEKSELKVPKEQEGQVEKSEADVPKEQEVQEKKSEAGVLKGPESQVKNTEVSVPETLESQVKKSESGVLKGKEAQEKKESFEDKGNNDKEKERDAEKDPNKKEKGDKNTKGDKGKDKVKGKRESEINGEKSKGSKRAKANKGRKYNKKVEE
uniref:Testis expressed basic protein 1 n=1 Tax=Pan troglodytes TaxID=9598 RepID=H2R7F9_PANTR